MQSWMGTYWSRRVAIAVGAAVGVLAVLWLFLAYLPPRFVPGDSLDERKVQNEVRTTLVQSLGGAVLGLGAYFTARQLRTSQKAQEIAREGQITERYTRAVDQLGHAEIDVRVGGVYALERLAGDSPDDLATIGEVLTSFVRGRSPWPPSRPGQYHAAAPMHKVPELQARNADVQAAVTVLVRGAFARDLTLDLHQVDLRAADLVGARLEEANLRNAHLERAKLTASHLEGAELRRINFQGAALTGAHLEGADLTAASLEGVNLLMAHLEGADLTAARLEGANLRRCYLQEAIVLNSHLQGADLRRTRLQGADLRNANLEHADLRRAQLQGADLRKAYLEGAKLVSAHLEGADLRNAHLEGADLARATHDDTTLWPDGFVPSFKT
jgi:uncharacterized protein YjbI with pentapeptide repeats